MNDHRVIIFDPTARLPQGALVSGPNNMAELERRGVVTIPVIRERSTINPVGDYFFRAHGPGWPFFGGGATRACPMLVFVDPSCSAVHWRARLMPIKGIDPDGMIRLAPAGTTMGAVQGGLSATALSVDCAKLGPPDELGGWNVGGESSFATSAEGYLSVVLYGPAQGVSVAWSALSVT